MTIIHINQNYMTNMTILELLRKKKKKMKKENKKKKKMKTKTKKKTKSLRYVMKKLLMMVI